MWGHQNRFERIHIHTGDKPTRLHDMNIKQDHAETDALWCSLPQSTDIPGV